MQTYFYMNVGRKVYSLKSSYDIISGIEYFFYQWDSSTSTPIEEVYRSPPAIRIGNLCFEKNDLLRFIFHCWKRNLNASYSMNFSANLHSNHLKQGV